MRFCRARSGLASRCGVFALFLLSFLQVAGQIAAPLIITRQPQNSVVEETKAATFAVSISGSPAYFQWYKDGVAVPNANTNPLTIPIVSTSNAGAYFVVVTNSVNSVTSSVAVLTVIADTNSPTIVDADGTSPTNVLVSFSELVAASSATNTANYRITNTVVGATIGIIRAVLTNGTNVLIATTPRVSNANYILVVNNVRDISQRQNAIAVNSSIPISTLHTLLPMSGGPWRYWQPQFFADPADLGTVWKDVAFDDSAYPWQTAATGGFLLDIDGTYPWPFSEPNYLGESQFITSYYRGALPPTSPAISPGGAKVYLRHYVDDGAIFYLNGTPVLTYNMPTTGTPIDYQTRAATALPAGSISDPIWINNPAQFGRDVFTAGSNLFAVELHQAIPLDLHAAFNAELSVRAQSLIVGPVVATGGPQDETVVEGEPVIFSVIQAGGSTFQWQQNNNGIVGATNSTYLIPRVFLPMDGLRFRVVVSNSNTTVTSSNAVLRVLRDSIPPALLAGFFTSNSTVTLIFSEPLDFASATTTSNYRLTNSLGQLRVPSAVTVVNETNVVLHFISLPYTRYIAVVNNVRDTAVLPNTILPNSSVVVGFDATIQPMSGTWRYDDQGADRGSAWTAAGYNDASFTGTGSALFGAYRGTVPFGLPEPLRTTMALSNAAGTAQVITYYFRQTFNAFAPNSTFQGNAILKMRTIVDDGCVIHVNGSEVFRLGMPTGTVTSATFANRSIGDPVVIEGPFFVELTNLVDGTNVIAVEVHQASTISRDAYWAGEFSLSIPSTPLPPVVVDRLIPWSPPALRMQRAGTNIVLSWQNPVTNLLGNHAAFRLQHAYEWKVIIHPYIDPLNTWPPPIIENVTEWFDFATNAPVTIPSTNSMRFYRLKLGP